MRRLFVFLFLAAVVPCVVAWTWPVSGPVLQTFSFDTAHPYAAGQHRGIAIGADTGAPVLAPASGVVTFAGTVPTSGRSLTIQTPAGLVVTLTHLGSIAVPHNANVAEGAVVGTAGPSGTPEFDVPYVHLGVRDAANDQGYLDPLAFLPPLAPPAAPEPAPTPAPAPVATPVTAPPAAAPPAPEPVATTPTAPDPVLTTPAAPDPVLATPAASEPVPVMPPAASAAAPPLAPSPPEAAPVSAPIAPPPPTADELTSLDAAPVDVLPDGVASAISVAIGPDATAAIGALSAAAAAPSAPTLGAVRAPVALPGVSLPPVALDGRAPARRTSPFVSSVFLQPPSALAVAVPSGVPMARPPALATPRPFAPPRVPSSGPESAARLRAPLLAALAAALLAVACALIRFGRPRRPRPAAGARQRVAA